MDGSLGGPAIVLALVLAEVAIGGLAVLWLTPLWRQVRMGFFKLAGGVIVVCAVLAWLAAREPLGSVSSMGRAGAMLLAAFAAVALLWQVLLWARAHTLSQAIGVAAVPVGIAALVAIAAEPDQLYQLATFFIGLGAEIISAVTTTGASEILEKVPAESIQIGDLGDFEDLASDADLLVTHSHGRQVAERLGIPLLRIGFPVFDRLGSQHRLTVLYQGTRDLIFEAANVFQANQRTPSPEILEGLRKRRNAG